MYLFEESISSWEDWSRVFQSIEAFTPLAEQAFRQHGLPFAPLTHLTPGTNAVFRSGDFVIKISFPKEAGLTPQPNELPGMVHAEQTGVGAPRAAAFGAIEDRYRFPYLIMEWVEGTEAGSWRGQASKEEKIQLARQLREQTRRLNQPPKNPSGLSDSLTQLLEENHRWREFPLSLQEELQSLVSRADEEPKVFVHGDLTGENLLLTQKGMQMIDFGDCRLAPFWYEWPPLVNELFCWDPWMLQTYFSGWSRKDFLDILTKAMGCHDFGGDMVRGLCFDYKLPLDAITGLSQIRRLLGRRLADALGKEGDAL